MNAWLLHRAAKPVVFALALAPFAWLLWGALANRLGANPAEAVLRGLGDWTLRLLLVTLAVTPLRRATGWTALARLRRMLGLFTFFYACLHLLAWAWLDMGLDATAMLADIAKRPFILVGTLAFALLVPLAATSANRAVKALGARRWQALHRLVYAVAVLAIVHFWWMRAAKGNVVEVAVYGALVLALLAARLVRRRAAVRSGA